MSKNGFLFQEDGDEGLLFQMLEGDWISYLTVIDDEAGRFFKLFIENRHVSNHLDIVFNAMRWGKIIFSSDDTSLDCEEIEVVTFHKSPVNIASRAVFFFIEKIWDIFLMKRKDVSAATCWNFAKLINTMQREMLSGIASVDSMEYDLAICHFKNVLAMVNEAILARSGLPDTGESTEKFIADLTIALFDIRELALQSIMMCSAAAANHGDGFNFN
jgi:hypothetical protein